jgi:hypothetical protein
VTAFHHRTVVRSPYGNGSPRAGWRVYDPSGTILSEALDSAPVGQQPPGSQVGEIDAEGSWRRGTRRQCMCGFTTPSQMHGRPLLLAVPCG